MPDNPWRRRRVHFTCGCVLVLVLYGTWQFSPGIPVLWGPWARAATKEAGRGLFEHEWTAHDPQADGDGLGPVFNERSCVACHFQGGVGGGGPNENNVTSFQILPTKERPEVLGGLIHASATEPVYQESMKQLRGLYPVIKGRTRIPDGCTTPVPAPDFDPVRVEKVNSTALFGAGWIDRISPKSITHNRRGRVFSLATKELQLDFSSIPTGRTRILADGRVGKFGWKAQFATLEEFVATACAQELGLGTPVTEQARPRSHSDYPETKPDLNRKQFNALVAFVDTLPRPVEVLPESDGERSQAARGKDLFHSIGCAVCHVPDLGGVKGVYSDFLLHRVESQRGRNGDAYREEEPTPEMPLPPEHPEPGEWKTPPLWGVADSAPYFHDGGSPTLAQAIQRHGRDAQTVTDAYGHLPHADQLAVIAFLQTLKAPTDAVPAKVAEKVASR